MAGAPVPTGGFAPPANVLLELSYAPLPGATGTELGITNVCVVLSRTVVVVVSAALLPVEDVAGELEVALELQAASPCATGKLLPESG